MTRGFYIEYNPMKSRAKLPAVFTREYGQHIQNYVILQDPKRNQIRVSILRKGAKIYFARGWTRLRDFYDLGLGGWLTVLYMTSLLFCIKVRRIIGSDIAYPERTPPYRFMIADQLGDHISNGPVPYFVAPRIFIHMFEKTLTSSDITSGNLSLPWNGFCENALPNEDGGLIFIDWLGHMWRCHLEVQQSTPKSCTLSGQWTELCSARNLLEGSTIRLGATKPANNIMIHLRQYPFLGVRTNLVSPTVTGGHTVFYQVEEHYML